MRTSSVLLVVVTAVALVGCEDEDLSVSDVYADLSVTLCQRIGQCCTGTQISCTSGRALDEEGCRELVLLSLRNVFFLNDDAVDEGRRSVDQDAARECIEGTRDRAREPDCSSTVRSPTFLPRACGRMFPGAAEAGDECFGANDCVAGAGCVFENPQDETGGVCVPLQREEEPCYDHRQCAQDLYCSADGYVCRPRAIEGGPCERDLGVAEAPLCQAGLSCDEESERCLGPGGAGDACTPEGVGCDDGLVCSAFDGTCIEPQPNGEPCLSPLECKSGFCDFAGEPDGECAADSPDRCTVGLDLIGVEECT